jgi:hypothetical protein
MGLGERVTEAPPLVSGCVAPRSPQATMGVSANVQIAWRVRKASRHPVPYQLATRVWEQFPACSLCGSTLRERYWGFFFFFFFFF